MRIAYIGNFEPPFSTENDVRKAFEQLGHIVTQIQEDKAPWHHVREAALQSDLLLWTSTWEPDNGGQPLAESIVTLRECAMAGIPTATLHLDVFFGSDRGARRWWLNPMFFTRYLFTADGDHQEDWKRLGVDHIWLPPALRHDAAKFGTFRDEYACDVAFVGSNGVGYHEKVWPYRRELVAKIREICQRNGWSFRNPGGELDRPNAGKIERGDDMNDFYASAKITVGDSLCLKKEASHYWSDRVPEATGRGGFLIMPWIDALYDMYNGSVPMYQWGNWQDLEAKMFRYLEDAEEREELRQNAQAITAKKHTYVNRAKTILKKVGLS